MHPVIDRQSDGADTTPAAPTSWRLPGTPRTRLDRIESIAFVATLVIGVSMLALASAALLVDSRF